MNYLSIDHLIVGAFLLVTLIIGLRAGRGIKDIREYAIANKMYGTTLLVITYLATDIGGASTIIAAAETFSQGIIMTVASLGVVISLLLVGIFIAPKMVFFEECITIGDMMESLYGTFTKILTGGLGLLHSTAVAGIQLFVLGIICESLLAIKASWGIVLGGLLVIFYSTVGGIKSVTITDVVQFFVLIVIISLIANKAISQVGSMHNLFSKLPTDKLTISGHKDFYTYVTLFLTLGIFSVGITAPPITQRLLMARNGSQLRNQHFIIAILDPAFRVLIMLIGLSTFLLYPTISPNNALPHTIHELLPIGIRGISIAGLIAVVMSTADSHLHAAGLLLAHDVIKPLCDKYNKVVNELNVVRVTTLLVGVVSIAVGLLAENMLHLSLAAMRFTGPLLMFPLVAGIMGLKPDKQTFYIASLITLAVFVLSTWLLPAAYSHLAVPISITANGISFVSIHLIKNKGFAAVNRGQGAAVSWQPHRKSIVATWRQWRLISIPKRIIQYSQNKVNKYGAPYMLFGVFFTINFVLPYFMWTYHSPKYDLIFMLRLVGGILCVLLIVEEKWPQYLLPYMPTFWHLTLLYCLPFTSTMMFLLTQGSVEWLINVAITIMFLIALVDWLSFLLLTALGLGLGCLFYTQVVGPINLQIDFSTGYLLVYQGIFATLIGLLFARRKQLRLDTLDLQNKQLATTHEETTSELLASCKDRARFTKAFRESGVTGLANIVTLSKKIIAKTKGLNLSQELTQEITQLHDQLIPLAIHLDRLDHRATGYLRLETDTITIDTFLQAVQEKLHAKGLDKGIRLKKVTQHKAVQCDVAKIETLLVNSISFIRAVGGEEIPILLALEDTQLGYRLNSVTPDYTKQIAALRITITTESMLPTLEEHYLAQMHKDTYSMPETPTVLPLVANERIVKAHYGYNSTVVNDSECTQLYVIPVKLREVRPKDMDLPAMELGAELTRADDTYPGAQEQEAAFLQAVQEHTQADLELVRKAIELIKQYHGPVCRNSGEPFYLHPLAVAHIVLDYNQDEATVLGALLHDTVEDTSLTIDQVEIRFNKEVRNIVDGVTHLDSYKGTCYKVKLSPHENIRMLLEVVDKRALYVKIADRTHNMRTIQYKSYTSQRRTAEETLLFFVPLAEKLELYKAAQELKERSFEVLTKNRNER